MMEINPSKVIPHPQFLEALFARKSKVSTVFTDVLGLYGISHIAISQICSKQLILSFSSTPALEYNLFTSNLWRFDKTYHPEWFTRCIQTEWQALYSPNHYAELYYLKQVRHCYLIGYSFATKIKEKFLIYSLASTQSRPLQMQELFANQYNNFCKIGEYCSSLLQELFEEYAL